MQKTPRILDYITDPSDLHKLSCEELEILANEIREEIVRVTSKTGGHVSSSLGAVDIILAVHSMINSPYDKFVFDVSHQAYAHKLVTGRQKDFHTLRKFDGLSGFVKPVENIHDVHYSGHAADSLSVAMGLSKAKVLNGSDEKVIALIGDASIAGGMAFEALNHIGQEGLPLVIILNDNKMSISESVGGVRNHLSSIRLDSRYSDAMDALKYGLLRLGSVGDFALKCGRASKVSLKHFLMPNSLMFEELGITCLPIVDGHNISSLRDTLEDALNFDGPVLIHAITQKGAGYDPAVKDPESFHGIGAYNIRTGKPKSEPQYTFTNCFSDEILKMGKSNDKIVAMTAAMAGGTGLKSFENEFPERFIDVGIAEEHLVGTAAGLAKNGYKPFVAIYSAFLQRAIDQMVTNVALENLNVTFCIDRAGIVGADGSTHHGLFDMVYTRMIPNFTVIAPSCAYELRCALKTAEKFDGPFAIRYPRGKTYEIGASGKILKNLKTNSATTFEIGKSRKLTKGSDASILAFGDCVIDALEACEKLKKQDIKVSVYDMRFVKPLDVDAIKEACQTTDVIVSVEDGIVQGGVGQEILHHINEFDACDRCKFKALGVDDKFVNHGPIDKLKTTANIDVKSIVETVVSLNKIK